MTDDDYKKVLQLLNEEDINIMIDVLIKLGYTNTYYLQNFLLTSSNIGNIKEGLELDKSLITSKSLDIQWRN